MSIVRLRRLRKNNFIRNLVSETQLSAKDLIMPYFVTAGKNKKEPVESMPGIFRLSIDNLLEDVNESKNLGIKVILLFGVCAKKNERATEAYRKDGLLQRAIKAIKKNIKDIVIMSDVCLCAYTSHGHCGVLDNRKSIDNDATLKILSKIALSHAQAGVDFVAPSAMMDGEVRAIREALDKNSFKDTGILGYSAKYASNFYGPFREALGSSAQFGDRKSYQMDFRNSDEAQREIKQDIDEGADMVMVKPALAYLDVIYRSKQNFNIPLAAYNVSGEYAMVKAYCPRIERERKLVLEILTSIKRAGADFIITYHAKDAVKWLKD